MTSRWNITKIYAVRRPCFLQSPIYAGPGIQIPRSFVQQHHPNGASGVAEIKMGLKPRPQYYLEAEAQRKGLELGSHYFLGGGSILKL